MEDLINCIIDRNYRTKTEIEELNLSNNNINDNDCKQLAKLIAADKKLKILSLEGCPNISKEGFKIIIKALKRNNHVETLNFQ